MTGLLRLPCTKARQPGAAGFSLVELLLALGLGVGLSALMLQVLLLESDLGLRLNRQLRERKLQQRTLALLQADVLRASQISSTPQLEAHACGLSGRQPVLHLRTSAGPVTYSVGAAPSGIWRGQVLMRCGPAFDLEGQPSPGAVAQNRVVLDGLASTMPPWQGCEGLLGLQPGDAHDLGGSMRLAFSACLAPHGLALAVRLMQEFDGPKGRVQRIGTERLITRST